MDMIKAVILAVIEGLSEFLPISSTGHMLMARFYMHIDKSQLDAFNTYIVAVQFGAIMSIPVVFYKKFFSSLDFYFKLAVGFIPAASIGLALNKPIDALFKDPVLLSIVVSFMFVFVGLLIMNLDEWYHKNRNYVSTTISYKQAIIIGLFQCFALLPGVSRSAATIFGGLSQKLNWKQATEFSFFLAVPTLTAAGGYKLIKDWDNISYLDGIVSYLVVGNLISFVIALITVSTFIKFVQKTGFRVFGVYRVIIGLLFFASILRTL